MTTQPSTTAPPVGPDGSDGRPTGGQTLQHMQALERANELRQARAAFKRQLKADGAGLAELRVAHTLSLSDRPAELASMRLFDLVVAIPRFGRARALPLLMEAGVSEWISLTASTFRQRQALAVGLDRLAAERLTDTERRNFERQLRDG